MSIMTPPLSRGIRGTDQYGSGAFGASRDGGLRQHAGVDLISEPHDDVLTPCEAIVTMHGIAYATDPRFKTIRLQSVDEEGLEIRFLYVLPIAGIGTRWAAGVPIASAQDISLKYLGITNHVHMELRRDGIPIDPTRYLLDA